jgi:hypothetical protein
MGSGHSQQLEGRVERISGKSLLSVFLDSVETLIFACEGAYINEDRPQR